MGIKTALRNGLQKLAGTVAHASRSVPGYWYRFPIVISATAYGFIFCFVISTMATTFGEQAQYGIPALFSLLAIISFIACRSVALKPPPIRECYVRRRRTRRR